MNVQLPLLKVSVRNQKVNLENWACALIKPLFLIFIFFAAFGRNVQPLGLSGGLTAVFFGFLLFIAVTFHYLFINEKKTVSPLFYLIILLFAYLCVKPLLGYIIYGQKAFSILRYSIEVGVNFGMLFSVYYVIKNRIVTPKFFLYTLAIFGGIVTVQLLANLTGATLVRRVAGLGGALNYTGSVLAMSTVVWAMIIYSYARKRRGSVSYLFVLFFMFFTSFVGLFLTGTRAGLLSFLMGITLLQLFGMQSKKFTYAITSLFVLFVITFLILSTRIDFSLLFDRFTYDELSRMVMIRFELYAKSVTDLTLTEFIFGRADLYTFSDEVSGSRIVNTHNLFLSLIRYNGLFSFILFAAILLTVFANYIKLFIKHQKISRFRLTESSILILLCMALLYSMSSGGRITKIFIVFIQLGFSVGYIELLTNLKSSEDYKRMIL